MPAGSTEPYRRKLMFIIARVVLEYAHHGLDPASDKDDIVYMRVLRRGAVTITAPEWLTCSRLQHAARHLQLPNYEHFSGNEYRA